MKKDINFETLADDFIEDIFALLQEFVEIRNDKESLRKKLRKEIHKNNGEQIDNYYNEIKKSNDSIKSQIHLQNALFTYLYSTYEKHIDELVKFSIRKDSSVRLNYFNLYKTYLKDSNSNIPSDFINFSKSKQAEHILEPLRTVKTKMDDINREQFLFDIPDKIMWRDKNLKFNIVEIRARRNLITHRKAVFDKQYVSDIKHSVTKSKKVDDPKKSIEAYVQKGLYPKIKDLEELLTKENIEVRNGFYYFFHVFKNILYIYSTVWNYVTKSPHLTSCITYELNKLFLAFPNRKYLNFAELTSRNYKKIYPKTITPVFVVNYLLSIELMDISILGLIKNIKKDIKASHFEPKLLPKMKKILSNLQSLQKEPHLEKEDMIQFLKNIDPTEDENYIYYQMTIAISERKSKDCISLLKKADIHPHMEQWPLFQLLFKKQKLFKDAFEKQLKKTQKKHKNYQKN